jgi:hypothetical protein
VTPPGASRVGGPVDGGAGRDHPSRPDETDDPRAPALRAVGGAPDADEPAGEPPRESSVDERADPEVALHDRHGLALAYAALDRLVAEHALTRAAVVVTDPDLGRQVLYDRGRRIDDGDLALFDAIVAGDGGPGTGLVTAPALEPTAVDAELLVTLAATALRVAVLDATSAPADGADVLEIAVRQIGGVAAVTVDRLAGVVQVVTAPGTAEGETAPPADLAARVVDLATSLLDGPVAVEILRGGSPSGATRPAFGAAPVRAVELVAVTSALDTQETEVHLRRRDVRTIGRAPAAHGLAGGVEATVDALRGLGLAITAELDWARTIETTSDRRFVVAIALSDERGVHRYGLAEGGTPVAAAAQAALDALAS